MSPKILLRVSKVIILLTITYFVKLTSSLSGFRRVGTSRRVRVRYYWTSFKNAIGWRYLLRNSTCRCNHRTCWRYFERLSCSSRENFELREKRFRSLASINWCILRVCEWFITSGKSSSRTHFIGWVIIELSDKNLVITRINKITTISYLLLLLPTQAQGLRGIAIY